ncbi:MAG: hypothetical protein D6808_00375 [Candidatus Dadabacteria bacterium]|nr:MAG: hypothetical protein D6808_00375 [Candidatus Dadabacteria bacterium]
MKKIKNLQSLTGIILIINLYLQLPAYPYTGLCCGKCGGNMPLNIPGGGVPETFEYRTKISYTYMNMDGLKEGRSDVKLREILGDPANGKFMAAPKSMAMQMGSFSLGYSFTDDFFAGFMAMWNDNTMPMRFNSKMQNMTGREGYDMESAGFGDTMFMAKYRLYADDPLMPKKEYSLLFGLSIPTGSIDKKNKSHPLKARQDELLPYSMQTSTGTIDPTVGFLYEASSSPHWWGINSYITPRFTDNHRGYHLGSEAKIDMYYMYQFRYNFLAEFQINAKFADSIHGEADSARNGSSGRATKGDPSSPYMTPLWDPDNYGGTKLFATAGIQWQPFPLHILNLQLSLPIYQDLNGPQLKDDYRLMLTWYIEFVTNKSRRYLGEKGRDSGNLGF